MKILIDLAWRNLWRHKRRTLITVSSVSFAVVLAVLLVSFAAGMRQQLIETVVRNETGYLQVQDVLFDEEPSMDHAFEYGDEVKNAIKPMEDEIHFTVPRIRGFSLAAGESSSRGVVVTGIKPGLEDRMNNLSSRMAEGRMFADDEGFAVAAEGLAGLLDLSIGDKIVLIGQGFQGMTAAGEYEIGGIIKFPIPEQNNSAVYLPLEKAQSYFAAPGRLTNLIIMTDHDVDHDRIAGFIRANLDPEWYAVLTWDRLMPDMVGLIETRETVNRIMSWVLYMVAGFGIFGTIMTMMAERLKEFGVLLSIGMKRSRLACVCLTETILISVIGAAAGIAAGYPLTYLLHVRPLQLSGDMAEYMLNLGMEPVFRFLPSAEIFLSQALIVFCISLVIGIYPVKKIFRLDMISAVRG